MKGSEQVKIKASTQGHLDVDDIVDDLVILKSGWVALVLSVTAVNFDILSEAEQDATIYAYGALLNSLSFPVQILIRSKKADITAYFHTLSEFAVNLSNPDLKRQVEDYLEFLKSTVQQKTVLDKRFYVIVNFSPLEQKFGSQKGRQPSSAGSQTKSQLLESAKYSLAPKRDHIVKQLARLGLYSKQLVTQELIELFYDIYNPAPSGTQRVIVETSSYTTPMVEPAIEVPTQSQPELGVSQAQNVQGEVGGLRAVPPPPVAGQQVTAPTGETVVPRAPAGSSQEALAGLRQATQQANELLLRQPKTSVGGQDK